MGFEWDRRRWEYLRQDPFHDLQTLLNSLRRLYTLLLHTPRQFLPDASLARPVYSPVIFVLAWPVILLARMLTRRRESWPKPKKSRLPLWLPTFNRRNRKFHGISYLYAWAATLDGAVNKRNLSTGETRDSARNFWTPRLEPGVEHALPRSGLSNQRDAHDQVHAKCFGYRAAPKGPCQQKAGLKVRSSGYWLPDMDSNHDSRLQRPLSYH